MVLTSLLSRDLKEVLYKFGFIECTLVPYLITKDQTNSSSVQDASVESKCFVRDDEDSMWIAPTAELHVLLWSNRKSHNHQFLSPAIWWRWVRMNDLHCPRSFVKSTAPLNDSPINYMSSFILSIQRSLGLLLFLLPSNLACSALYGIRSIVILSTSPNHRSLRWTTLSGRVFWLPNACLMSNGWIINY